MTPVRRIFRRVYEATRRRRDPLSRAAFALLWVGRALFRLAFGTIMRARNSFSRFAQRPAMRFAYHLSAAVGDALRGSAVSRKASWTETHLQHALNILSARLLRARDPRLRAVMLVTGALQKYRERVHASTIDFSAILDRSVNQAVLRNFVAFQYDILRDPLIPPQAKVNLLLRVGSGVRDGRLNELFSVFCLSDLFSDLTIHWDAAEADAAERQILTVPELHTRQLGQYRRHALSSFSRDTVEEVEHFGVPRAFTRLNEGRRNANVYLKATFAWHFVVAVSLREDNQGNIDADLRLWEPLLLELEQEFPAVRFTLLNRAPRKLTMAHHGTSRLPYACEAGLNLLDTVALAQQANAFFGVLDVCGLAARSAGVPGVYLPLEYELHGDTQMLPPHDNGPSWHMEHPTIANCREALRQVLAERGALQIHRYYSRTA